MEDNLSLTSYFNQLDEQSLDYLDSKSPELIKLFQKLIDSKPDQVNDFLKTYCLLPQNATILVIIGPSGSGKGMLITKLFNLFPNKIEYSVSYTTRKQRPGEMAGKSYFYIEKDEFEGMLERNEFLEFNYFSGNYYGTSLKEITRIANLNKVCLLEIDINGLEKLRLAGLDFESLAIMPKPTVQESIDELRARLLSRNTENEETINKRLAEANEEIPKILSSKAVKKVFINDDYDVCFEEIVSYLKEKLAVLSI